MVILAHLDVPPERTGVGGGRGQQTEHVNLWVYHLECLVLSNARRNPRGGGHLRGSCAQTPQSCCRWPIASGDALNTRARDAPNNPTFVATHPGYEFIRVVGLTQVQVTDDVRLKAWGLLDSLMLGGFLDGVTLARGDEVRHAVRAQDG